MRFSYLVCLSRDGSYWTCRCDCGRLSVVRAADLKNGNTKSCGCRKYRGSARGLGGTLLQRYWQSITFQTDGCWQWSGCIGRNGYGKLGHRGRTLLAHRLSYRIHVGSIPDGLELDHLCRNRWCVNPDHLEAVTHSVNVQRGNGPESARRRSANATHCRNGHQITADSFFVLARTRAGRPTTERVCKACLAKRQVQRGT